MKKKVVAAVFLLAVFGSCQRCSHQSRTAWVEENRSDAYAARREKMVREQIAARGIRDAKVLQAMRTVPREQFIPDAGRSQAYADHPVPIGYGQTISQPYIVAFMTEALQLRGTEKVLEIGTGSGYQAAILAEITPEVYSIEIICELLQFGRDNLDRLGYQRVKTKCADGYRGWPEYAPFDAIIVTAAPDHVPAPLVDQLKVGGRLLLPVGDFFQELILLTKTETGVKQQSLLPVRFVPMTGEAEKQK